MTQTSGKTFDALYAELSAKVAARDSDSSTVARIDAGVHKIGKKIVEEAAEVWMAAEFQSKEEAAEEISQLLYHLQVMMLALDLTPDDIYAPPVNGQPKMSAVTSPDRPLLRVAVPNKGALAEPAAEMLREAGYAQRTDPRELLLVDEAGGVEFFYLRPRDIAVYVGEGTLDIGITGRDMLLDSGAPATEVMPLGFGRSRFRFAAPGGRRMGVEDLHDMRLATSYPGLVGAYLKERGVITRLITLDGAVETAIRLGVADAIADVVETGTTLRQAGLELFGDPILESEAVLIRRSRTEIPASLPQLERRLNGVLVARNYVMMDYDVSDEKVDAACDITPGLESPTVSPLAKPGWHAVRAMVPRADAQQIMDDLWTLGARAILVTDIAACRL